MTAYTPRPLATAALPADLLPLVEQLAENAHDVWAVGKLARGFRYGPVTDDAAKTHKNLVPYAHLTDAEKDQDRDQVAGVLGAVLALGYRVSKE